MTDALLNYETVKYFTSEELEAGNYGTAIATYQSSEYRMLVSLVTLNFVQCLIMFSAIASGMTVCISKVATGDLTVGDAVLFLTLMGQLYGPLNYFGSYYRVIQQNMIDMENLFDLLGRESGVSDAPGASALAVKTAALEYRSVTFSYDPARTILRNVSFKARPFPSLSLLSEEGGLWPCAIQLLASAVVLWRGSRENTMADYLWREHLVYDQLACACVYVCAGEDL